MWFHDFWEANVNNSLLLKEWGGFMYPLKVPDFSTTPFHHLFNQCLLIIQPPLN